MEHEQTQSARVKDYFARLSNAALYDLDPICWTVPKRSFAHAGQRRKPSLSGALVSITCREACPSHRQLHSEPYLQSYPTCLLLRAWHRRRPCRAPLLACLSLVVPNL